MRIYTTMPLAPDIKIIIIVLFSAIFFLIAAKKPNFAGLFEFFGLCGIFLFSFFILLNVGIAIFGMVMTIIFFIAYKIAKRDYSLPETGFNIPVLIYAGIVLASFFWTYDAFGSINQGGEIVYFFAFFFAVAGLLKTEKRINLMIGAFAFSSGIAILYGLIQGLFYINALHSVNRVTGPIGNWTGFPVQVSFGIVVLLCFYVLYTTFSCRLRNFIALLLIFAGLLDVVMSKARSAWIGIIPALLVLIYLKSKKMFAVILVIIVIFNGVFFLASKTFRARIFSMVNSKVYSFSSKSHGDIESHLALIESSWKVFKRFPLTGVGVGAFSKYFDTHEDVRYPWYINPKTGKKTYDLYDDWPENGYMQTLAETGIFSFIVLMWFFFEGIRRPIRSFREKGGLFKKKAAMAALGASIVFYGSFLGVSNMSNNELSSLWLFFLAVFAASNLAINPRVDVE